MPRTFRIEIDGIFCNILNSTETPDGLTIFRTFTEARNTAATYMANRASEYREAARHVRAMRVSDVIDDLDWRELTERIRDNG